MTTKKRATRKKATAKKAPQKSAVEKFVDSPIGLPVRIVNKTFLASLGLISMLQTEFEQFQSDFGNKFDQLVKDGEKARRRYKRQLREFRNEVADEIEDAVEEVQEDVTDLKERIVENVSTAA